LKQRTANPSASSAIETEVRMFLSSSTRAIVFATDASPKVRCGPNRRRSERFDSQIWRLGGKHKGAGKAIRCRRPPLLLCRSGKMLPANHKVEAFGMDDFFALGPRHNVTRPLFPACG